MVDITWGMRTLAMEVALWILAGVVVFYFVVRLGLAWMIPEHYRVD
jgi:hypothetical protein